MPDQNPKNDLSPAEEYGDLTRSRADIRRELKEIIRSGTRVKKSYSDRRHQAWSAAQTRVLETLFTSAEVSRKFQAASVPKKLDSIFDNSAMRDHWLRESARRALDAQMNYVRALVDVLEFIAEPPSDSTRDKKASNQRRQGRRESSKGTRR